MPGGKQGLASMDEAKRKLIASMGGKAAHERGTARRWDRESAREAGRLGGIAAARKRKAAKEAAKAAGEEKSV